jgi:chromate transporter
MGDERSGSIREVFLTALRLGLTSFGGPIAHLGYFERTYVCRLGWLSGEQYGSLVSLCQLLPGPTSSQVGFLIGLHRAGWPGAIAAWAGFTLPSALLMYAFAMLAPVNPGRWMQVVLHGLMLIAVVVVAKAVWNMARSLTPDLSRRLIAVCAFVLLLFRHDGPAQLGVMAAGALAGAIVCRSSTSAIYMPVSPEQRSGWIALLLFVVLLVGLPLAGGHGAIALAHEFYQAGALVFGGGHVVLPLLQQSLVPGQWIAPDRFLAGYGFAQVMPGPLFTFAAYLGAACAPMNRSVLWSGVALLSLFLPGLLLAVAGLSLLGRIARNRITGAIIQGVNAAVVGLLVAALFDLVRNFLR